MITLTRDGQTFGPYSETQILDLVKEGEISRNELAWKDGLPDWKPLTEVVDLGMPPLPLPVRIQDVLKKPDVEKIILNEHGILVTSQQVKVGGNVFVVRNIGGVSVGRITGGGRLFPLMGMVFFGMWTIAAFATGNGKDQGMTVFMVIMAGSLALLCAAKTFKRTKYAINITASGGMQKAFSSTDKAFVDRVAQAIQRAIL